LILSLVSRAGAPQEIKAGALVDKAKN